MANKKMVEEQELEVIELDAVEDEGIAPSDFIVVFDREGKLKSMLLPDNVEDYELPEQVQDLLKACGIDDITDMAPHTLH